MGFDLLDTPVRLTWEIPADTAVSAERLLSIADRIADAGVFYVTLQGWPLVQSAGRELISCLRGGGCQVLVTAHGAAEEFAALRDSAPMIDQLLFDLAGFLDEREGLKSVNLQAAVENIRQAGIDPILSLVPLRQNLQWIPDILQFCQAHEIAKFKLPNASIGGSFREYSDADLPRAEDLETFRELWRKWAGDLKEMPTLEVHDLFLWEIMTPGQEQTRSEYGGCQAANSLAHVAASGDVYPCSAWSEPLGSLLSDSLFDIWQSAHRLKVREEIQRVPEGCAGCCDWLVCRGGCRGLSRIFNRANGGRDLQCSGRRSR